MSALPCPDPVSLRWWRSVDPAALTVPLTDRLKAALVAAISSLAPPTDVTLTSLLNAAEQDERWLPLAQHLGEALADHPLLSDLQASALLLGAVSGCCRWSTLMLSLRLAERVVGSEQGAENVTAGLRWCLRTLDLTPVGSVLPARVAQDVWIPGVVADVEGQPGIEAGPQDTVPIAEPATLRILEAVPPPAASSADNRFLARYHSLASPLPLRLMPDPDRLRAALDREFPWMDPLNDHIAGHLMLARRLGRSWFHLPPLLITGPAGAGKSRWARRLTQLAGTSSAMISAAGSADNKQLASASRTWSTGRPCLPVTLMVQDGCPNPIIIVDEIDKTSESRHNGNLCDTLLMLTAPETSRRHYDEYLLTTADLSAVTWILLANTAAGVPALLRSRLKVVEVGRPRPEDGPALLRGILEDFAAEYGVSVDALPTLEPEILAALESAFRRGRLQARQLRALVWESNRNRGAARAAAANGAGWTLLAGMAG
jgi:hypothetical protein